MSPALLISLVPATMLVASAINHRITPDGRIVVWIADRLGVDPEVPKVLMHDGAETLAGLPPLLEPGQPPPVCRYFVERDIPGSGLVAIEYNAALVDVRIDYRAWPEKLTGEISAHSTHILKKVF